MRPSSIFLLTLPLSGCFLADGPMDPTDHAVRELEVPPGSTARGLGTHLAEMGLIPSRWRWRLFLYQTDGGCLKAGRFEVRRDMSMHQLLDTLCGPPLPDDVPFTVVEGWRIRDIDSALTELGWIEAGTYSRLATDKAVELPFPVESPTLEGYLFPETYRVPPPPRFDAASLIERQLELFQDRFLDRHPPEDFSSRSLHDVVVMASMLEREEPSPENRPTVAGILWKRLDHGWQLGVDATSRYSLDEWNDRRAFLTKLRDPTDPYNTRERKGLPPTAIGSPSPQSLEAALAPEDSPYWYYLHDGSGTFHGSRNANEHEATRRRHNVY